MVSIFCHIGNTNHHPEHQPCLQAAQEALQILGSSWQGSSLPTFSSTCCDVLGCSSKIMLHLLGFTSTWLLPEIGPPHAIIQKYTVLVLNQGNTHLDVKNVVTMDYHDGFSNVRMDDIIHVENAKCKQLLFNRRCLSLSVFLCLYTNWYRRYRHSPTSEG